MLLFLVVAVGSRKLFGDADTATHVATGRLILERHVIPRTDPFSAGAAGREWFAHEWLADVAFAAVWGRAGWPGVVWLSAVLIVGAHLLLYRHLVRRGDDALASLAAVVGAASTASVHWLARPHLFTVLLLVLAVVLLEEVTAGRRAPVWLAALPVLAAVWANLHGGFLVLLPILACYGAGLAVGGPQGRSLLGPWAAASAASALAMLINPWGGRLILHLLGFFAARGAALQHTEEFAPPILGDRAGATLAVFLALCALGIVLGYAARRNGAARPPRPATLLAFLMTTAMALRSVRDVEIMAVFGAILLADGVSAWLETRTGPLLRGDLETLCRREAGGGGGLALAALLAVGVLALSGPFPGTGFDPARFPVAMVARLRAADIRPEGPVVTPDVWGGYLILEWPESKVWVDGRWDMRGDAFFERYADLILARPGWGKVLDDTGAGWALLPPDAALAAALRTDPRWVLWGSDGTTEAWTRRGPAPPAAAAIPRAAPAG